MNQSGKLSARQKQFIQAMMTCRTTGEAAKKVGVTRRTGERWLGLPHVNTALAKAQSDALACVTRQLIEAMIGALDTLQVVHQDNDSPATARVSAARAILESGLKYTEMVDLAQRVTELEARINGSGDPA